MRNRIKLPIFVLLTTIILFSIFFLLNAGGTTSHNTAETIKYEVGDKFFGLPKTEVSDRSPYFGEPIDIDNDEENELVFYTVEHMTKRPHTAYIVKGDTIIFKYHGAQVSIADFEGISGFVLNEFDMIDTQETTKTTTFLYDKSSGVTKASQN